MAKKPQMDGIHVVSDLETLKVLSDPLRMNILRLIGTANLKGNFITVKELSEELDIPPTKLYYHINLLEKHGLILVGDTEIVSGIVEKKYQLVAEDISVDKNILDTEDTPEDEKLEALLDTIRSLLDGAYLDLKKSLKLMYMERAVEKKGGPKARQKGSVNFTNTELHLTVEQADNMKEELESLMKTYDALTKKNLEKEVETITFGFSYLLAPHYHKGPQPESKENDSNE